MTDQIDYLFVFPDEATAIADHAVGGRYYADGAWNGSAVIPGPPDGELVVTINGAPVAGWPIIISIAGGDPALDTDTQFLVLKADRDKALKGDPTFLMYVTPGMTQAQLNASVVSPTFAGSNYPFGNAP